MRSLARPLRGPEDLDPLLHRIGEARIVAIGEAGHGTHEYYAWRAALTRRLVGERNFRFVAVEGDWPDCCRVNRSVRLRPGSDDDPRQFCRWLREFDAGRPEDRRVGFDGIDVHSLRDSMQALVGWLREHEPEHEGRAIDALRCFEPFGEDGAEYAFASRFAPSTCEQAVVDLLHHLCEERGRQEAMFSPPAPDPESRFSAEQNAAVVVDAERYYREMVQSNATSWNVRDVHMVDTLDRLLEHAGDKVVVWGHNTRIGDARATDMAAAGLVDVGFLLRDRHGRDDVVLVGFGGHRGAVVAGAAWGVPMEAMPVPPARPGSLEALLHERVGEDALFVFPRDRRPDRLTRRLDHRAIGVVHRPERERFGNYVPTVLGERYDAFLHLEDTTLLRPLHMDRAGEHVPPPAHAV